MRSNVQAVKFAADLLRPPEAARATSALIRDLVDDKLELQSKVDMQAVRITALEEANAALRAQLSAHIDAAIERGKA